MLNLFFIMFGIALDIALLCLLIFKKKYKEMSQNLYYDDGLSARFFITGDKHRNFNRVKSFCQDINTCRKEVLIIFGDMSLCGDVQ